MKCEECDSKVVVIKELRKQNIILRIENANLEEIIAEVRELLAEI
jgi:hypothetical protein